MIAACYIRVSTDDQTEYSPDSQLREIRDFCVRNGWELADEFIFIEEEGAKGASGRSTKKRSVFNEMISVAKSKPKPFDVLVVWKFSRFARNREDSIVYKSMLRKQLGIDVVSVSEPIGDDKLAIVIEAVIEAMDEYYSINLAEEVRRGMTEKAMRGEPLSIAPYGYKLVKNQNESSKLVIDPDQAEVVRNIFAEFIGGVGYMTIAKKLNALGMRTNRGGKWENRTIEYILRNPVYIGKIRWNPARRTRRRYNDEDILTSQGVHEPIISEDDFAKAQDRVMQLKLLFAPNEKQTSRSHWLVGLVKCSNCGKGLVKNGKDFLQCRDYIGGKCNISHALVMLNAEAAIIAQMESDGSGNEPLSANIIKQKKSGYFAKNQAAALERRLARAKDAYEAGIDSLEEYRQTKERLLAQLAALKKETDELSSEKVPSVDRERILSAASILKSDAPTEEKKAAAASVIHSIIYDKPNRALLIQYLG